MLRAVPSRPEIGSDKAQSAAERLVDEYVEHLDLNCGLALATRRYRARYAREFLEACAVRGVLRLSGLTPQGVMRFVAARAGKCRRSSAQVAACSVRSLLRFLVLRGLCGGNLVQAVPRIPQWRQEGLPRFMTEEQLRRLLDSFDRSCATGRRDYAMTLFMVALGLRVSEVTELHLDDIDWRAGTVRIRSAKNRRTRLLPLPNRVGKATARYLHGGRPSSTQRQVFLVTVYRSAFR
jgi:site-specific recombinase XerD